MSTLPRIGAVVLTYNSVADLPNCLNGLLLQKDIDLHVIVVDNASGRVALAEMEAIFKAGAKNGALLNAAEATPARVGDFRVVFLRNNKNAGYSAGNNIGARLAVDLGCEAVLIVNPDVQISDPQYLAKLWRGMQDYPDCAVGASKIVNLADHDENPIRELGFWEELLWFRQYGPQAFRPCAYVQSTAGSAPVEVEKLHGCCILICSSFLEAIGYFDENVFLYSEEPILASQVHNAGKQLMLFPHVKAVHAHVASTKGNSNRRMQLYIMSRLYYLDHYAGYGPAARAALHLSYGVLSLLHAAKARIKKLDRTDE